MARRNDFDIVETTAHPLRIAFSRVMRHRNFHSDFLRVSKETEERLSIDRPSTLFFY